MIFNDGQMSRLKVLRRLGIKPGANAVSAHFKADLSRIKQSEKRFKNNTVEARRAKRRERLRKVMANKKKEGVVYGPARKNFVKENSLCENCLRNHPRSSCTSSNCRRCNKSHNTLLHEDSTEVQAASGDPEVAQPETTSHFSRYPPSRQITLMPTAIIEVLDIYANLHPVSKSKQSILAPNPNSPFWPVAFRSGARVVRANEGAGGASGNETPPAPEVLLTAEAAARGIRYREGGG
ncbi:hypothetical protein JTE90_001861 [Oedothorax gibbosus]|uniref:Uncharacterized protein n=1 Tax=Oedothorax gibbosus TaxID=931172 RepID=A0AAV6VPN7_9ARAC|nr:hypothetical protein JTE90_001861 [Oedothorax gibbosus]